MSNDRLAALAAAGVSIWLDDLSRERLRSGNLQELITDKHVVGVTTNPTIFAGALANGEAYDEQVRELAARGASVEDAIREITVADVQQACDVFRGTWETTGGVDGRVSLEVDPGLARDTDGTVAQALDLWKAVDRPNLLVKIPATEAGLPAITQALAEGVSVNVTLIFSVERYRAGDGRLPRRAGAGRGQRPPARRHRVGRELLRLPRRHRDRQAAGEDRHRRGAGAARQGRRRQLAAGLRGVPGGVLRRALGRAGREGRQGAASAVGVDRGEEPGLLRHPVRHRAGRRRHRQHDAGEDAATRSPTTARCTATGSPARPPRRRRCSTRWSASGIDLTDVFLVLEDEGVDKFEKSWAELGETVARPARRARAEPRDRTAPVVTSPAAGRGASRGWSADARRLPDRPSATPPSGRARPRPGLGRAPRGPSRPLVGEIEALRDQLRVAGQDRVVLAAAGGVGVAAEVICADGAATHGWSCWTPPIPAQVADALAGDLGSHRARGVGAVRARTRRPVELLRDIVHRAFRADGLDAAARTVVVTDAGRPAPGAGQAARTVVLGPADVDGPWAALTAFALVPAGLAGADVGALLADAAAARPSCRRRRPGDNPCLALGALLAGSAGRRARRATATPEPRRVGRAARRRVRWASTGTGRSPVVGRGPGRARSGPTPTLRPGRSRASRRRARPGPPSPPMGRPPRRSCCGSTPPRSPRTCSGVDPFDRRDARGREAGPRRLRPARHDAGPPASPTGGVDGARRGVAAGRHQHGRRGAAGARRTPAGFGTSPCTPTSTGSTTPRRPCCGPSWPAAPACRRRSAGRRAACPAAASATRAARPDARRLPAHRARPATRPAPDGAQPSRTTLGARCQRATGPLADAALPGPSRGPPPVLRLHLTDRVAGLVTLARAVQQL